MRPSLQLNASWVFQVIQLKDELWFDWILDQNPSTLGKKINIQIVFYQTKCKSYLHGTSTGTIVDDTVGFVSRKKGFP